MEILLGVRKEDKNIWERRVPVTPDKIKILKEKYDITTIVEPFEKRSYSDDEFSSQGAVLSTDLSKCKVIAAVKEVPINKLIADKTYLFFSHTIKAQTYNMPLLQAIIDKKITLIDYERITDGKGRRLVFFGKFAGLAGMIDTLSALGKMLKLKGYSTAFEELKPAYEYKDLGEAKEHIRAVGERIKKDGLPEAISPLTIGFAGYGNVSQGAQEVFDVLPFEEISPKELMNTELKKNNILYKVVFKEEDLVKVNSEESDFDLQEYYTKPQRYSSIFHQYLNKLSILINAIYWTEDYPRLIEKKYLQENYKSIKLDLICDISCDIHGSVEITEKATEPDKPSFTYFPKTDSFKDGCHLNGIIDLAVDNLPTELPRDAAKTFSDYLFPFLAETVKADYSLSFEESDLPDEIKRAVVVYKGELTPDYQYLKEHLK